MSELQVKCFIFRSTGLGFFGALYQFRSELKRELM